MDKKTEALKLALEALEDWNFPFKAGDEPDKEIIIAIREALAEQPAQQQEPVAYLVYAKGSRRYFTLTFDVNKVPEIYKGGEAVPLYTSPPASKPLTDEQIDKLPCGPHEGNPITFAEALQDFARAIEAAHGIKE